MSVHQARWGSYLQCTGHSLLRTDSIFAFSAQAKPRLQRGGSSASLHNSLMRNSIFQLMIHTLDPLAEGKHQTLVWELVVGKRGYPRTFSTMLTPDKLLLVSICQRKPCPVMCFICHNSVRGGWLCTKRRMGVPCAVSVFWYLQYKYSLWWGRGQKGFPPTQLQ